MKVKSNKRYVEPRRGVVEIGQVIEVNTERGQWLIINGYASPVTSKRKYRTEKVKNVSSTEQGNSDRINSESDSTGNTTG